LQETAGTAVVALNRETGCTRWTFKHDGPVGTALVHETRGRQDDPVLQ
jgi:hypothetical protein